MMIYWQLFLVFLQIGALSFGGGYAAIPLIEQQIVTKYGWLTLAEFTDLITVSQMTPGPIAVNSATFVGLRVAGVGGALAASAASVLPAIVIVTGLSVLYFKFRELSALQTILQTLRPVVVALIATAGVSILTQAFWSTGQVLISTIQWNMAMIFAISLYLLVKRHWDPILVMVSAGVLNLVFYVVHQLF